MLRRNKWILAFAVPIAAMLLAWLLCVPSNLFEGVPYSTVVMAEDGTLLGARIADDGQWRFPPADSLPEKFAIALVEYEDRNFYVHPGVDFTAIARAAGQNLSNGRTVSGASTITMQTIRLHRRGNRNIFEKGTEMFMATRLETMYSKDEILRMYASHAPFGENVVGIEAAIWRYLGHSGAEMSWAEAATLAVMQNAPSSVNLNRNRDRLLDKRDRLLKRLYDDNILSDEEYELAVDEPLIRKPDNMPVIAPHLVEYYNRVSHGQRVVTAVDFTLQQRVERVLSGWRSELSLSGINDIAAVVIDVATGETVAYCGNTDISQSRNGAWVDIARAPRSSGSILKPLLYCAAMQEGEILKNTLLPDIPTDFGGFTPKNFDGNNSGVIPADEALALSLNVPYVDLLKQYGVNRFATLLHDMGLSTIKPMVRNYGLSLILGGAEVRLADVVKCYADIARMDGNAKLSDPVAVYDMLDAMRSVNRPDQMDYTRVSSVQNVAWKTGTSYGARDGWAIGVTPRYAVGVWVGNADGTGVAGLTGARTAGPVMFDIFNLLPPSGWFEEPHGEMQRVCVKSGHIAGRYCSETEMRRVSANASRSKSCPYCMEIPVSLDGQRRVANASEPSVMKPYFILPPVYKYFYKNSHTDYVEPPQGSSAGELKIIYPSDGAVISLPGNDENRGNLVCKATHSDPAAHLFWHLDNGYVATTSDLHQLSLSPGPGLHRLTIVDENGNSQSVSLIVR